MSANKDNVCLPQCLCLSEPLWLQHTLRNTCTLFSLLEIRCLTYQCGLFGSASLLWPPGAAAPKDNCVHSQFLA